MLREMKVVFLFASLILVSVSIVIDDDHGKLKCDESGQCTCYNKDGKPVHSSPDLKACQCFVERDHYDTIGFSYTFPIKCTKEGKYRRLQCQYENQDCFYVNTNTGIWESYAPCAECYKTDCLYAN